VNTGTVIKSTGSWYKVKTAGNIYINCNIKGNFRIRGIRATNPVTVGDIVDFTINPDNETGCIMALHPRKNYLIRRSSKLSKEYQLLAANIDTAWVVASLAAPKTLQEFIDRLLVTAEAYRIPTKIIFNKTDLLNEKMKSFMQEQINMYTKIGYECFRISVKENLNINLIKDKFKNKINVLTGNSGVGKSSLLNAIDPDLKIKTMDISEYHKQGKHSTTFPEMHELKNGGYVIDTPGIRGFGVIDMEKNEIYHFFPEIFKASADCQFSNCLHVHEPGCAVKEAVKNGMIHISRYSSYLSILDDRNGKYR